MEKSIDTDNAKAGCYSEMLRYSKTLGFKNVSDAIDAYGSRIEFVRIFKQQSKNNTGMI